MPQAPITEDDLYRAKPRAMSPEHLQAWMVWHGLGQTDVAATTKVNRRTVYRWLKGLSTIPRTAWPRLAQAYADPLPWYVEPQAAQVITET